MAKLIAVAVIVVVLGLGAAVTYIHRGAVARLEAENLVIANKVQRESTEQVLELAESERQKRDTRIVELEAAISALPRDNSGAGQSCPTSCTLVWDGPNPPVLRHKQ